MYQEPRSALHFALLTDVLALSNSMHHDAAARVRHAKVGVGVTWPHWHVVPEQVVILQLLRQPLGQTALARSHTRCAGADCRAQCCHVAVLGLCDIVLHIMPSQEPPSADKAEFQRQKCFRRTFGVRM